MNKDDPDFFRYLKKDPNQTTNAALDLIKGLQNRQFGQNVKSEENLEIFAEEQLVRKTVYDEMRCEMPGVPRSTFLMVFSPDGTRVASTHGNHNIYITDIRTGKHIRTLIGHPRTPWCIAFHPTSNQIVASGCLGGQVRIWDLSGGSEIWTATNQTVIASLAFHPTDRVLVIATYNELHFWDWSQPHPFVHVATSNPKEKVRFVAFDTSGHKLITGISNSPQTRWERVRAPVPVPRQERSVNLYRRRITPRIQTQINFETLENNNNNNNNNSSNNNNSTISNSSNNNNGTNNTAAIDNTLSSVPERVRRITMCYKNLVREYEQLVQRYLQLYQPPIMIDRGTDPMEPISETATQLDSQPSTSTAAQSTSTDQPDINTAEPNTSTAEPSTSAGTSNDLLSVPGPSTSKSPSTPEYVWKKKKTMSAPSKQRNIHPILDSSSDSELEQEPESPTVNRTIQEDPSTPTMLRNSQHGLPLLTPGRIFSVLNKASMLIKGTQTQESRKHKAPDADKREPKGKRLKKSTPSHSKGGPSSRQSDDSNDEGQTETTQTALPANETNNIADACLNLSQNLSRPSSGDISELHFACGEPTVMNVGRTEEGSNNNETFRNEAGPSSSNLDQPSTSRGPQNDSVEQMLHNIRRTAEEDVQNKILPIIWSVPSNDRPEVIRLFELSRRNVHMRYRNMFPVLVKKKNKIIVNVVDTTSDSSSSDDEQAPLSFSRVLRRNSEPASSANIITSTTQNLTTTISGNNASTSSPNVSTSTNNDNNVNNSSVRNFNTELEQLVTSLLTEIERSDTDRAAGSLNLNLLAGGDNGGDNADNGDSSRIRGISVSISQSGRTSTATTTTSSTPIPPVIPITTNSPPVSHHIAYPRPFQGYFPRFNPTRLTTTTTPTYGNGTSTTTTAENATRFEPPPAGSVPVYGNHMASRRRRFFSHRISAFMPTRVNYNRSPALLRRVTHSWGRRRPGVPRPFAPTASSSSFGIDELVNYSERENSEDDTPTQPLDLSNHTAPENNNLNMYNTRLGNVYSNIVHDLESSLSDVIRMRASNRPGETSDMLGNFSERLDHIMQQSDLILSNLSSSMDLLNTPESSSIPVRIHPPEPAWTFYDQSFYMRDQRNDNSNQEANREDTINISDIFVNRPPCNAVAADHTYPRNPDNNHNHASSQNDNMSPLVTSLHMTISHIQRQARLLRRQVENIERIDRAMLEVGQLQLIRQLVIELVRHVRNLCGENRSTGMSSVRQMMAFTRISDSSPYESPAEEPAASTSQTNQPNQQSSGTSSSTSNTGEQSTSSGVSTRPRSSNRKTYPPGRFFRLARQYRKPSIIHFFSRRSMNRNERNSRQPPPSRPSSRDLYSQARMSPLNYSCVNSTTLSSMTRRLQQLLIEQVRNFTSPRVSPSVPRSSSAIDLGEHILAARLHECAARIGVLTGNQLETGSLVNVTVTQDGESRYRARYSLSTIIENMTRLIDQLGNSSIPTSIRQQFHGVLVMSLLLTELQLLVIVDSIPPPSGINLIPERASLTSRIDQMCNQMLQNRNFSHSQQLTRSLRLMKLTMRHAHSALGQTYNARRNEMLPRINTNRQQVLGSINRCLRIINRQRESLENTIQEHNDPIPPIPDLVPRVPRVNSDTRPAPSDVSSSSTGNNPTEPTASNPPDDDSSNSLWYSNFYDFFLRRYPNNRDEDTDNQPSTNRERERERMLAQYPVINDTDGDDDDTDGYSHNNNTSSSSSSTTNNNTINNNNNSNNSSTGNNNNNNNFTIYNPVSTITFRSGNVNVTSGSLPQRPWNVPSVQVNDLPVSEPTFRQRLLNTRQRFAERVSELRSNPMGLFRPRFLHPLYANVMNPFDVDLDDQQREPWYDSDMITTVTPNHRIQAWDVADWSVPVPEINDALKNVVVGECKIHNDASVDIAKDGTILVTLLPSGGYLNVTNRLGVYSLRWETLGQCLYTTSFEQNAVSVSLSPLSKHLIVGLTHRIITSDRWIMARIFKIEQKDVPGDSLPVLKELEQNRDSRINCIRWLPSSGQGLIYATNTGQLVILS